MKTITNNQILGEKGVNLVQSIVLQMGFTWHPSNQAVEAGIDGWVEIRDQSTGEVGNSWLAVQSRALSDPREDDSSVKYTCRLKDVEYWMSGNQPVILVVSKPEAQLAWWISVKDYFQGKNIQTERGIVFDKKQNLLSISTADEWKALGSQSGAGTYLRPPRIEESLGSNLIKISRCAEVIYRAKSKLKSQKSVQEQLKLKVDWPPREWFYGEGGCIYSFHDLTKPPWHAVCESGTVTQIATESVAYSDCRVKRRDFVWLLNGCLQTILGRLHMRYSRDEDCHYFKPKGAGIVRTLHYRSRKNKTSRGVVSQHQSKKDNERIAYFRHDAFSHQFLRFGDAWYLMIEPTYLFTTDGKTLDPYREERLSKIKSIEGDAAVSGKLVMFADLLKDKQSLYDEPYAFLGFDGIEAVRLDTGIDDDAWARIKATSDVEETQSSEPFGDGLFD